MQHLFSSLIFVSQAPHFQPIDASPRLAALAFHLDRSCRSLSISCSSKTYSQQAAIHMRDWLIWCFNGSGKMGNHLSSLGFSWYSSFSKEGFRTLAGNRASPSFVSHGKELQGSVIWELYSSPYLHLNFTETYNDTSEDTVLVGIVLEFGEEITHIVPVHEGYPLPVSGQLWWDFPEYMTSPLVVIKIRFQTVPKSSAVEEL